MNYLKKNVLFAMILLLFIVNHGIGQVAGTKTKSDVKKVLSPDNMSISKPLGKLQLSGMFTQGLIRGSERTHISGGVVINIPGDTSILGNIQVSINNINVPRFSPGSYSLNVTNTSALMQKLLVKIVNKPPPPAKCITWVTAKGTINPVQITSPPSGYIHEVRKVLAPSLSKAGITVTWTSSPDEFKIILDKLISKTSTQKIKHWGPKSVNSQFIPDSLLEPGQNYIIRVIQLGKRLTLKGNFKQGSVMGHNIFYSTYFSTK